MLSPQNFIRALKANGISYFTGVPDSLLKNICAYIADTTSPENNIIAANEGAAIGLATGYYLSTGKIPMVYMQNSGLGNAINPLLSLVDKEVYNIPVILLIGWRGEPGVKDEPQHIKQGKVTIPLLNSMGIEHAVLAKEQKEFEKQLQHAINHIHDTHECFAFVVQKETFENYSLSNNINSPFPLSREEAIQSVIQSIEENDIVVSTTGMISRELFECREALEQGHKKDFLTVGSMGHASQIALGIALQKKDRKVYCLDGDGAILMHMGALATIGTLKPNNYKHILFNNGAHDSVGGQPTVGLQIDIPAIALACGYQAVYSVEDEKQLKEVLHHLHHIKGPVLLEIKIKKGARKNLGRPTTTPIENKGTFMEFLE